MCLYIIYFDGQYACLIYSRDKVHITPLIPKFLIPDRASACARDQLELFFLPSRTGPNTLYWHMENKFI